MLVGLTPNEDGTLTTVDGDPQMILENVGDRVVRTISYTAQFDGEARELCLYYTTKVGEDYSADRRVFPRSVGEGRYIYTLPRTSLAALRLDPCSPEENKAVTLTMSSITLNAADTLPHFPPETLVPPGVTPASTTVPDSTAVPFSSAVAEGAMTVSMPVVWSSIGSSQPYPGLVCL